MQVLQTRTRTVGLLIDCSEAGCDQVFMAKLFAKGEDMFIDVADGWQSIPRQSTTEPLVFVEFRCSKHHFNPTAAAVE